MPLSSTKIIDMKGMASELGEGKETDLQLIFALASMLAYLSRTDIAIRQLEKLSWDWIKMDCSGGKCYGLLAVSYAALVLPLIRFERSADDQVHRFCFALVLFHLILSACLVGVQSTKTKRASIQNGYVTSQNYSNTRCVCPWAADLRSSDDESVSRSRRGGLVSYFGSLSLRWLCPDLHADC